MKLCYLNGKFLFENEASVGLTDLGLLRGYGVFDYLRTYNGKVFLFDEHLKRLRNSAHIASLEIPIQDDEIKKIVKKLLVKNNYKESNIRIVLTGGPGEGNTNSPAPTFYILISELKKLPDSLYSQGVKLVTYNHQRELPQAKTINYMTWLTLKKWQTLKKAYEILYTSNENVLEATTSNFFIFKGNKLITPKSDILLGMTRNLVVKLSKKYFNVVERTIKIKEMAEATEAFITATNKEIIPVITINSKAVGDGKVGVNTKKLMKIFQNYVTRA